MEVTNPRGAVATFSPIFTITDELNEPMIGVSVLEKGTTNGVITDLDGNYTLSESEGSTIVFSYIGYVTQEKKAVAGTMNIIPVSYTHLDVYKRQL